MACHRSLPKILLVAIALAVALFAVLRTGASRPISAREEPAGSERRQEWDRSLALFAVLGMLSCGVGVAWWTSRLVGLRLSFEHVDRGRHLLLRLPIGFAAVVLAWTSVVQVPERLRRRF